MAWAMLLTRVAQDIPYSAIDGLTVLWKCTREPQLHISRIRITVSLRWIIWLFAIDLVTLTHWGRLTHICISKLKIIGSDNDLSLGRRQAIIWTNAGLLSIWPLGTNFIEILIEIYTFSFRNMHLKMSSGKLRPFCLGLNVLRTRSSQLSHGISLVFLEY